MDNLKSMFQPTLDNLNNIDANQIFIDGTLLNLNNLFNKTIDTSDDITEGKVNKFDHITVSAPLGRVANNISISQATTSISGYLTFTDWNTFNNKQNNITASLPISKVGDNIQITQSNGSTNGYLSSTDWTTFNNKENVLTFLTPLNRATNNVEILPYSIYWSNILRVDKNGDDAKGVVAGYPFKTIGAASTASVAGQVVLIGPGVYGEQLILKGSVSYVGTDRNTCSILGGLTVSGSLVQMAYDARIKNMTIYNASTTDGIETSAIRFPGVSMSGNALCENCHILNQNTAGATNITNGVLFDGSGTIGFNVENLVGCFINAVGSSNETYGVKMTTSCQGRLRNCHINSVDYGVKTNNAGSILHFNNCSITGTTTDISQDLGQIILNSSSIVNKTANGFGFQTDNSYNIVYGCLGALAVGTRYLWASNVDVANEITQNMPRKCIVKAITARSRVAITAGRSQTFSIRKNKAATAMGCTITAGNFTASITNLSVDYNQFDELSLECSSALLSGANDVTVMLEVV